MSIVIKFVNLLVFIYPFTHSFSKYLQVLTISKEKMQNARDKIVSENGQKYLAQWSLQFSKLIDHQVKKLINMKLLVS